MNKEYIDVPKGEKNASDSLFWADIIGEEENWNTYQSLLDAIAEGFSAQNGALRAFLKKALELKMAERLGFSPKPQERGSEKSGYYAPHKGRPGQVGGSKPRDALDVVDYTEDDAFSIAAKMGRVVSSDPLEVGVCGAEILEYADDGSGVWKEMSLIAGQHDGNSEVAAYRISELLGLDIVPETVFTWHDGRKGTSQRFIPDADVGWGFWKRLGKVPQEDRAAFLDAQRAQHGDRVKKMIMLDFIIDNHDRHNGNWLIGDGGNGRFWAVDHGHCRWGMRNPWMAGGVINPQLTRDLYGFNTNLSIPDDTLQKWREITPTDWGAAMEGVSEEGNVNLAYAWGNFQDLIKARELSWEY